MATRQDQIEELKATLLKRGDEIQALRFAGKTDEADKAYEECNPLLESLFVLMSEQ